MTCTKLVFKTEKGIASTVYAEGMSDALEEHRRDWGTLDNLISARKVFTGAQKRLGIDVPTLPSRYLQVR